MAAWVKASRHLNRPTAQTEFPSWVELEMLSVEFPFKRLSVSLNGNFYRHAFYYTARVQKPEAGLSKVFTLPFTPGQ